MQCKINNSVQLKDFQSIIPTLQTLRTLQVPIFLQGRLYFLKK
jgi:hypothetical protein